VNVLPFSPGLPVWPLQFVAALSLGGAATCLALGVRDVMRAFSERDDERSDTDQPGGSTPSR
jgi:hypothetical protein